jgi:hypothetical protein
MVAGLDLERNVVHMRFIRLFAGVLVVLLIVGLVGSVFQAGYLSGAAGGAPAAGAGFWPFFGWPFFGWGLFGFGLFGGLFHLIGTVFFLIIVIALVRAAFGGRRGRGGWGTHRGWGPEGRGSDRFGGWESRARELHDDWHRRTDGGPDARSADARSADAGTSGGTGGATGPDPAR